MLFMKKVNKLWDIFTKIYEFYILGWGILVSTVTGYRLENQGLIPHRGSLGSTHFLLSGCC